MPQARANSQPLLQRLRLLPEIRRGAAHKKISLPPNVKDEPLGPKGRVGSGGWLGFFFLPNVIARLANIRSVPPIATARRTRSSSAPQLPISAAPPTSTKIIATIRCLGIGHCGFQERRPGGKNSILMGGNFLCLTFKMSHGRSGPLALAAGSALFQTVAFSISSSEILARPSITSWASSSE
jgi:hypothetical protein